MIVFCTTCKNRTPHLELTLPKNLEDNRSFPDCKFLVVDYNSQDHLARFLIDNHSLDMASGRLVVYSMPPGPDGPIPFAMAHAKNLAHRCGMIEGGLILVNLDADNYTGPGFAEYIAGRMHPGAHMWARMRKGELKRGINGRIVVTASSFLRLGGYDEKYNTWSPDDKDFASRLDRLGSEPIEIDVQYLDAVQHTHRMRFKEYEHVKATANEDSNELEYDDHIVANFGRFGEATVYRNFDRSNPITIGPVPTRIFGIGLHKTATTSLDAALDILGYDSAHWLNAHWAKAIYQEMMAMGRSPTLERHYALCDLPIALLYEQLDRAYPGSKFILTTRDESAWLKSVGRHWNPETNKFRQTWNKDPFTHFIHNKLYGRKDFDAETMLATYRRHNDEVRRYFAGRPDDLLVLKAGDGWDKLCNFLGHPVPPEPYPWRYRSDAPAPAG